MMVANRQWRLWVVGALLLILLWPAELFLQDRNRAVPKLSTMMYLPSGEYLRTASLGYREVLADLLWLQTIQVMGERKLSDEQGQWLYRAFDIITTIDPTFVRVYETGAHALCSLVLMPEESNRLLEKGMRHNPQEWRLPFILGINYYFEIGDDKRAADAMALASRLPGAPDYTARLAAKLYVNAKTPEMGIELLQEAYESATDDNVRKALEIRLKETIVERDIATIQEAIGRYRSRYQHGPANLNDLVGVGLLTAIPTDPFGGRYSFDGLTGKVKSSAVKERMRITTRRRGQFTPN
ncbi:conserved exported protein of unknown function [Nitrospira sp. KM1]|uniref:tetratricopeptide repeat protein n=1 Tax=Nitrospira sp. KM1 TaxID=1936990 RepID=UPI0013A728F2|nr:hypothetical protein [Nitrospira sp. KM1]BCA54481.1 conserved exported protein of unknown function [Nitrospira sp. KM1]